MQAKIVLMLSILGSSFSIAQVPQTCLELPSRNDLCDHQLYKRAAIQVDALGIKQGQMICLCMADFNTLRIPIREGIAATQQQVELQRAARSLGISQQALLQLVRD